MVREIITFVIAVIGFSLSLYNFVSQLLRNRMNLVITISNVFRIGQEDECTEILNFQVINKSKEPISLSRLVISCEDRSDGFGNYRKKLIETTTRREKEIIERKQWSSDMLPIKIEGLGCYTGLLVSNEEHFVVSPNKECHMKLYTNKGETSSTFTFLNFSELKLLKECQPSD